MKRISGHIIDLVKRQIFDGIVSIENNHITAIEPSDNVENQFVLPGFIDAHIHIESSMLIPSEFARQVLPHGTVACVCDPHEIANVCGIEGIDYMINDGKRSPLRFMFGAPSCVPATSMESSGAILDATDIEALLQREDIGFLAEMMNFPGVLHNDEQVALKIKAAKNHGKPIDGHAPELSGEALNTYVNAGISTDHECTFLYEAFEKIALGMNILIREGSAAKNLDQLMPLIRIAPHKVMLCSDDKHPDDILQNGHIDSLVRRILNQGYDLFDTLRACSLNPIKHYKLDVGLLQVGDRADFITLDNFRDFTILETWLNGEVVAKKGAVCYPKIASAKPINNFHALKISANDLEVVAKGSRMQVILVDDGSLYTKSEWVEPKIEKELVVCDLEKDILKLVVYNRYHAAKPSVAFIRNFGLKKGALASTVAHDNHNIVAIGTSDAEIANAINALVECKGGIVASEHTARILLPLPIGGLMADKDGVSIAENYEKVDAMAKRMGSTLSAPFMTLAFMSLIVIPELKLSDKGLFDVQKFAFTSLFSND